MICIGGRHQLMLTVLVLEVSPKKVDLIISLLFWFFLANSLSVVLLTYVFLLTLGTLFYLFLQTFLSF